MGEVPTTENKTLGVVESLINGVAMNGAVPIVVNLISSVPALSWLKIWPLSTLLRWGVEWIAGKFSVGFQVLGVKVVITLQTESELNSAQKAEAQLRQALLTGDPDAIKKSSDEFDKSYASLVHWDGSSPIIR